MFHGLFHCCWWLLQWFYVLVKFSHQSLLPPCLIMLQINKEIYLRSFGVGTGGEEEALNYRFDDFLVSCFRGIAISQDCFIHSHKNRRETLLILRPLSVISLNGALCLQITFIHAIGFIF